MLRALILAALLGAPHPIHSSSAVVSFPAGTGRASIVLRVFADDFPPGQSAGSAERYLAERFRVIDARERNVPLQLHGIAVDGAVLVLTLSAPAEGGLRGSRIWHGVLAERFSDQVNLVRVHRDGRVATVLFSAGEGPKPLP
jgi:hypothetical protein